MIQRHIVLAFGVVARCQRTMGTRYLIDVTIGFEQPQSLLRPLQVVGMFSHRLTSLCLKIDKATVLSHIQAASYYKAAVEGGKNYDPAKSSYAGTLLNFQTFPVVGSVTNYNSDSYITDSASAITAITTGHKTISEAICVSEDGSVPFETIAEKAKARLGYKVGVVSNANINHATPAGYYGHRIERTMYYELGEDLLASDFDYFGGGSLRQPTGANGDKPDLYELAAQKGYKVFKDSDASLAKLNGDMGKALITSEQRGEGDAMELRVDGSGRLRHRWLEGHGRCAGIFLRYRGRTH